MRVNYPPPPDPYRSDTAQLPPPTAAPLQYSPDRRWHWDGSQWTPVNLPAPPWARPYASLEGRATAAVVLVAVATVGLAFFAVESTIDAVRLVVGDTPALTLAEGLSIVLFALPLIPGLIGSAIVVPIWMHRAFRNLPALGDLGVPWSPAWAAGSWYIPFANLVIPYLVMRVLWSSFGDDRLVPELWWAAWIGFLMLRFVGYVVAVVNQPFGDVLGAIGEVIGVVAAIMLITMINQITRGERDRYAQLRSA